MNVRYGLLAALGLSVGVGLPVFLGGEQAWHLLRNFPAEYLLLLLGMVFVGWNFQAGRIRLLAAGMGTRLGQGRALATVVAAEFAISATPGGAGGAVTYVYLLSQRGLSASRSAALYAADQMMDLFFFLTAVTGLSLYWLLAPEELRMAWQLVMLGGLVVGGLGTVLVVMRYYRRVLLFAGRLLHHFRVSPAARHRLARRAIEFRHSMALIRSYSRLRLFGVYLCCAGHWLLRYSVLYLVIHALGGALTWPYAFVVQMLSLGAGQLSLLPGGSGGAEASSTVLLAPQLGTAMAAAAILVWRFVTFYWYLIAGAPVFAIMAGRPLWRRLTSRAGRSTPPGARPS